MTVEGVSAADLVAKVRDQAGPEMVPSRRQAEEQARGLLNRTAGHMTAEDLYELGRLISSGSWGGKNRHDRLSPAFSAGQMENLAADLDRLNKLVERLWRGDREGALAAADNVFRDRSALLHSGRSFPSTLLYLRDPGEFCIWFDALDRGLAQLSGYSAHSRWGGSDAYLEYCRQGHAFMATFGLEPEELDAVLAEAARVEKAKPYDQDDPWVEMVQWCRRFHDAPGFDGVERDWKLQAAAQVAEALARLLRDSDVDSFTRALRKPAQGLVHFTVPDDYRKWAVANPEAAQEGIRRLADAKQPPAERIAGFGQTLPRSAISGFGSRAALAALLLGAGDPVAFPPFQPDTFNLAYRLVGYPGAPYEGEAAVYSHALGFLDELTQQAEARGLQLRDRLDAQAVVYAALRNGLPEPATEEERHALERWRGAEPNVWWVNQGQNFGEERAGSYLWAAQVGKGGRALSHWLNVSKLKVGEVVVHYAGGAILAISRVRKKARTAGRPGEVPGDAGNQGWMAQVEYFDVSAPIQLTEIPEDLRVLESGAFNRAGGVNQGYLYPLSAEFATRLRARFESRWPEGSPWAVADRRYWLFQCVPEVWDLVGYLDDAAEGAEDDWTVTRYREEMQVGDSAVFWLAGAEAGVYALGEISGPPFERSEAERIGSKLEWAIPWRLTRRIDPPLLKTELLRHPLLRELSVIQAPQGTNFKVTKGQWDAIQEAAEGRDGGPIEWPPTPEQVHERLTELGFRISLRDLRRYHYALNSRGFVILSGISGTGKTWLAELYAKAVGARLLVMPVAPNWTTNEDLLGYFSPLDSTYYDTEFSQFLREAASEYDNASTEGRAVRQYHLVLDEMNLARVEYYFAKFLSVLEMVNREGTAELTLSPFERVTLHENLFFIGTVNVDETTHGFADKVFDRAQLIEFTVGRADLEAHLEDDTTAAALLEIWDAVSVYKPFAYRVADEITLYAGAVCEDGGSVDEAIDDQIMAKVLPKLSGSDPEVGQALQNLLNLARDRYPLTTEKAGRMLAGFKAHGFTGFF